MVRDYSFDQLELVNFMGTDTFITCELMILQAHELNAEPGEDLGHWMLENRQMFPSDWIGYRVILAGWQPADHDGHVGSFVYTPGNGWVVDYVDLSGGVYEGSRLVRLCRAP